MVESETSGDTVFLSVGVIDQCLKLIKSGFPSNKNHAPVNFNCRAMQVARGQRPSKLLQPDPSGINPATRPHYGHMMAHCPVSNRYEIHGNSCSLFLTCDAIKKSTLGNTIGELSHALYIFLLLRTRRYAPATGQTHLSALLGNTNPSLINCK